MLMVALHLPDWSPVAFLPLASLLSKMDKVVRRSSENILPPPGSCVSPFHHLHAPGQVSGAPRSQDQERKNTPEICTHFAAHFYWELFWLHIDAHPCFHTPATKMLIHPVSKSEQIFSLWLIRLLIKRDQAQSSMADQGLVFFWQLAQE